MGKSFEKRSAKKRNKLLVHIKDGKKKGVLDSRNGLDLKSNENYFLQVCHGVLDDSQAGLYTLLVYRTGRF